MLGAHLGEGVSGVVAEPADVVAGVVEVVRVAAEGSVVAEVLAVFLAVDGLPHRVDGLQDLSLHLGLKFRLVYIDKMNLGSTAVFSLVPW
jgi:hypothetical protein